MKEPSAWVVANADLLPRAGRALDLACGEGRHALWLASRGFTVHAVDRDPAKIGVLRAEAERLALPIQASVLDLESGAAFLDEEAYDAIVVVHYLHRPLFPALRRALKAGGLLLYETFTVAQAARGRPTNPAFLLEPGELRTLVAPLEIVREREGDFEGRSVAAVLARRPA